MNTELLYNKLIEAETVAGTCRENIFLDADGNRQLVIKDVRRLQALLSDVELLLCKDTGAITETAHFANTMAVLRRFWMRLNIVAAFLPLLFLDWMIHKTTGQDYKELRKKSAEVLRKCWYKF